MRRPLHLALLLSLGILASATLPLEAAVLRGDPFLVRDLNVDEHRVPTSFLLAFSSFIEMGGALYFVMDDGIHGNELWKIDDQGEASLVRDVCPGICGELFGILSGAVLGDHLLFASDDGEHGSELWITDGTALGTQLLADIAPGAGSSRPQSFVVSGAVVYFSADDGQLGRELWRTDGTPAGTQMVLDIVDGPDSSSPEPFAVSQGFVWLLTSYPSELWRSDGSASGTQPVTDVNGHHFSFQASNATYPCIPLSWALLPGGDLLFSDWGPDVGGLWRSDGTAAGTIRLLATDQAGQFAQIGADVLFIGTLDSSQGKQLWRSDGTPGGTAIVMPLDWPYWLVSGGSSAYFVNLDAAHGLELWASDGTTGGTGLVDDVLLGPGGGFGDASQFLNSPPSVFTSIGGRFLFTADDGTHGYELFDTDGLGSGASLVGDLNPGPGSSQPNRSLSVFHGGCPGRLGDELFFFAYDDGDGLGLWRTAGTTGSTLEVRDMTTQTSIATHFSNYPPHLLWLEGGERIFFTVTDYGATGTGRGQQLWSSDGSEGGTERLTPEGVALALLDARLARAEGTVYFATDSPTGGLWATDGTPGGTRQITTFAGPASDLTSLGDGVVMIASDGGTDALWLSDGTSGGPVALQEIARCGHHGLVGEGFGATLGELAFVCGDEVLWRTDGTPAGTWVLPSGARPRAFAPAESALFFSAETPEHGRELWLTDGTPEGTAMVVDLLPGPRGALPYDDLTVPFLLAQPLVYRDRVYFAADDGLHGTELWSSDGTAGGTALVADLLPGAGGSFPLGLTVASGRLYFVAEGPGIGRELWSTDGSTAGTVLVADLDPGPGSSLPSDLAALPSGGLAFAAFAPDVGRELFVMEHGGSPVAVDLAPGQAPSSPANLLLANRHLFFLANDNTHGFELWAWEIDPDLFADGFESGDVRAWSLVHQ